MGRPCGRAGVVDTSPSPYDCVMEHRSADALEWTAAPEEHFTGDVWFGPLSQVEGALNAAGVQFSPGARTDWHSHPKGQVLYVVSGSGYVMNESGERAAIVSGDVVYASPGELHWHGATPDSPMFHLSLTTGGATEWEPRKVSADEYAAD